MFEKKAKGKTFYFLLFIFYISLVLAGSVCWAGGQLERSKYITIDEIRPGMEAYCLTCFKGTKIERFDLDVLSVVHNIRPGKDAILVQGTDERFIHTGPVWGCSGSPVYIDGRLAGALAFAWYYSKDPLYGVTPIEEMLRVGQASTGADEERLAGEVRRSRPRRAGAEQTGFSFDFSQPIDFAEIDRQITRTLQSRKNSRFGGAGSLPCPLITYGLPQEVLEELGALVEPLGFMVISGMGGSSDTTEAGNVQWDRTHLVPGACLAVPLVTGDITMTVVGTVTEVVGDKVYGFGHGFLGYGAVDLPMATGQVHTVVSNVVRSFKFASALETVGALTVDESSAVIGRLGVKAKMIPLTIKVDRYNDPERRVYKCQVATNRLLTPVMLRVAVAGAAYMYGNLPPDHTVEYKVAINLEGAESISFENVSANMGVNEMIMESIGSVAMLMNNPYEKVDIKSVDFDIRILRKNVVSHIWSVDLSDSRVKAGQTIDISIVLESVLSEKKKYRCSLKIPDELVPGRYELILSGGYDYRRFLRKAASYRFVPENLATLVESMSNLLSIGRDKLYCILVLPSGGITVEKAELPDLPATKALVLQDVKRTLEIQPYSHWLEKSLETGKVLIDRKVMKITVEK